MTRIRPNDAVFLRYFVFKKGWKEGGIYRVEAVTETQVFIEGKIHDMSRCSKCGKFEKRPLLFGLFHYWAFHPDDDFFEEES